MNKKYLINIQHGADDVEKATIAMIVGGAAAAMEGEAAMFMTSESVNLAVKGGVDDMGAEGYPDVAGLVEAFVENGGRFWVCPACAGARGITAADLIPGAELAGAARTIGFINDGATVLM